MFNKEKMSSVAAKAEIVIAAILFVVMLVTCGMYIDIKMNGQKSSLPAMSEKDKMSLLRTAASEKVSYSDDLIEPVFVGVKNGSKMIAACPDNTSRRSIEIMVYDPLNKLFSGTNKVKTFSSDEEKMQYIDALKSSDNYLLIGFYNDIASNVFLPCLSERYRENVSENLFFVKYLFILPGENNKLYGVAVSSENEVQLLYPSENVDYGKIFTETYDISDGYSYFEYEDSDGIHPILSSSFVSGKYVLSNPALDYGKDKNQAWIENLFDVFSINSSLVKDFSSRNDTVINYVDEDKELSVSDDGFVRMKSSAGGIYLDEYLGYLPENEAGYSFSDKVLAVKNIINRTNENSGDLLMYSITGVDYDKENDTFTMYLKLFSEGILVTENSYDASFTINNDSLMSAEFYAMTCKKLDDYSLVLPQKYSNALMEDSDDEVFGSIYAMLVPTPDNEGTKSLGWVRLTPRTEVHE